MAGLITDKALVFTATHIRDMFQSNTQMNAYMVAANHIPYEDDGNPPAPDNSELFQYYDMARLIIFGKRIQPDDVALAIEYYPWTSGLVYAAYDDQDVNLHTKKFYTITKEGSTYSVFKCLYNNKGAPSTYSPKASETNIADEFYRTNDDYVWKLLYSVSENQFTKFTTSNKYFPCFDNSAAKANAVEGAIHSIVTTSGGSGYNSYISGSFRTINISGNNLIHAVQSDDVLSANTDFYKYCGLYINSGTGMGQLRQIEEYIVTGSDRRIMLKSAFTVAPDYSSKFDIAPYVKITGDGIEAEAIVSINATSNSIHSIEMVDIGKSYTVANVEIVANPAVLTSNNAVCRAIISPQGGHGSDIPAELNAKSVIFSTEFNGSENGAIPVSNDYRITALVLNPEFANTVVTVESSAGFLVGQTVKQAEGLDAIISGVNLDGVDTLRLKNIKGMVEVGSNIISANATHQNIATSGVTATDRDLSLIDNRSAYAVEAVSPLNQFIMDEKIYQEVTNAYGYLHSIDGGTMYLTGVVGTFSVSDFTIGVDTVLIGETSGAIAKINGYIQPDLVKTRGKCLYIQTTTPIERSVSQAERLKLVIEY